MTGAPLPRTDPDKVKLLHGPYRGPRLRRGARVQCLYRDKFVIVTGLSAGRIPWPLCKPPGRAHPGLLVEEELARAIRCESVLALRHWWGASPAAMDLMAGGPAGKAAVVKVAWPWAFGVAVPRDAVPSGKSTIPVGIPDPVSTGLTAAVNVTDWPTTGLGSEEVTTLVVPRRMVSVRPGEVLPRKPGPPAYTAVIVWLPRPRAVVV